ncbi:MAG TPA: response regulator [Acetivibrio sp.]|uniref:response regulator n=1 Tax=Acetivibrio sp. TaxID=1872092 RepID=UPI002C993D6C|nr:response regulator [Acetivibrio sp.]HOM03600.1 response regulator [Acetivibrio sp.]
MINTILVIDDNVFDNAIIKNYLYGERYSIVSAQNGREALELIESRNIDLILLDIVMPIMDGYDFLKEFSKTSYYKEIPVIVASSLDNTENMEKILEFDVFDYIIKPLEQINKLIFLNKIKSALKYRNVLLELNKATRLINQLSTKEA